MSLFYAFLLLFIWMVLCAGNPVEWRLDFSPREREASFIKSCLNGRNINGRHYSKKCEEMQTVLLQMNNLESLNRHQREVQFLGMDYYFRLAEVKNEVSAPGGNDPQNLIMDMCAPCSKFAPSVQKKWKSFFKRRTHQYRPKSFSFPPASQHLDGNILSVTFNRPTFDSNLYTTYERVAADLILHRASPCQINERFGTYAVIVRKLTGNTDQKLIVHSSQQASCATLEGSLLIASLNLTAAMNWFFDEEEALRLEVEMQPLEQVFTDSDTDEGEERNVLRRAIYLTFSFNEGRNTIAVPGKSISYFIPGPASLPKLARTKRSPRLSFGSERNSRTRTDNYGCRLESYVVSFKATELGVIHPNRADIRECTGTCELPSSAMLNATGHAITMKKEQLHRRNPPVPPTVDCVPLRYKHLIYYFEDPVSQTLSEDYLRNEVAVACGCA